MKILDAHSNFSLSYLGEVLSQVLTEKRRKGLVTHKHAVTAFSSGKMYSYDEGFMTNTNPATKMAVIMAAVGKLIIPTENMFNKYQKKMKLLNDYFSIMPLRVGMVNLSR